MAASHVDPSRAAHARPHCIHRIALPELEVKSRALSARAAVQVVPD
jgi:hypothetical protein